MILRCKKLINCLPKKYEYFYESGFLRYNRKFNTVTFKKTYLPLSAREILVVKVLIKEGFVSKREISKYLEAKLGDTFSEEYVTVLIHRTRKKIKLCTGLNLIRNKYGMGYYIL